MGEWKPLHLGKSRRSSVVVRSYGGANHIVISRDLAALVFGEDKHAQVLTNGSPHVVAIRGASSSPEALKLIGWDTQRQRSQTQISGNAILAHLGKRAEQGSHVVPHRIEDGMLVIDLSGLPDAEGR